MSSTSSTSELFIKLRDILSYLYVVEGDIRRVVADAGIDERYIDFDGKSINAWHSVLEEAVKLNKIDDLLEIACTQYGTNQQLQDVYKAYRESKNHDGYPDLEIELQAVGVEYAEWKIAQNKKFQRLLQTEIASRSAFKQALNVADNHVKLIDRPKLWTALDTWFSTWSEHKAFVILGEEGDGKTWGTAAWLHRMISIDATFPLILFLSSSAATSNRPLEVILQAVEGHDVYISSDEWRQRVRQWLGQPSTQVPTFLLVLDGINERRGFAWWRQLLESLEGDDDYQNLAVIITCRTEYWQRTFSKLLDFQTPPFVLQPYDDEELAQALNLNDLKRSEFSNELLELVRKPRYFDLAATYRHKLKFAGGITIARLIYEDWRDRWSRKSNILLTDEEFRDLVRQSAEKQKIRTSSFRKHDFDVIISPYSSNSLELLEELRTGGILQINEGRVQLDERLLVMGLGLLLVDQLVDACEDSESDLMEIAARWLEPNTGMEIKAQICEMAALHALLVPNIVQKIKVALLLLWISSQNPSQNVETTFAAYLPDNIASYIALCEDVWSEDFDNSWAQDLMMSAFIHWYPKSPHVRKALETAIERWLGMVHIAGFPWQRGNESERAKEVKEGIAQRIGFNLEPGAFAFADRTFTAIEDDDLLRLGRAALAIISHFPRNQFVHSLATGCLAEAIMGRPEKYDLFRWVLSTAPESVWLEVHNEVNRLLAFDSLATKQAAHRLLSFEGSNQAYELQKSFPTDLFPVHFLISEREKDPCRSWFAWAKATCETCVQRTDLEAQYIARRIESHALDPALNVPDELHQRFAILAETISTEQIWSTMATGVQDLAFEQFEPALCAFAPFSIGNVVRQIVQHVHTRNGLALRQISFRMREHTLLFEQDEMRSIFQAWQSLCHCLTTWSEEQEVAEMMLFSLVLLNLNAEQQLDHLLKRREVASDLLQYEYYFLPIEDWAFVEGLTAQITTERDLQRLLWFISLHPQQIPDDFLTRHIWLYVESSAPQVRRLAMKIIYNSSNRYLSYAIVGSWARDLDSIDEEAQWGSLILCRYGHLLSYEELCRRLAPSYWGYAVYCRGDKPAELNLFAEKLHTLWQHVSHQIPYITPDFPKTTIEVSAISDREKGEGSLLSTSSDQGSVKWQSPSQTWGGNSQIPYPRFVFPTEEEINAQRIRDSTRVRTLTEQENALGNPWFARRFNKDALEYVIVKRPELLEQWLNAISEENILALNILQRCHSFYEALCMVLLNNAPAKGVKLYQRMSEVNIISRDNRTQWLLLDCVLFRTMPSLTIANLWEDKLQNCKTDVQLLAITSMMQWGMGKEWLWSYIERKLAVDTPISSSQAITLLGFYDADAAQERLNHLYQTAPDTWIKQLLETSIQRWKLNAWSRHWFSRIFSIESNVDAWAAFRLFLRCVDSRFWIWREQTKAACSDYPDFERRWQHIEINWETIRKAIQKNEDDFQNRLFGQKILKNQAWPWM